MTCLTCRVRPSLWRLTGQSRGGVGGLTMLDQQVTPPARGSDGLRRKACAVRRANGRAVIRAVIRADMGALYCNMLHGFVRKSCNIWQHPDLFRCWYQGLHFNMLNGFVPESFNIFNIWA